MSNKLNRISPAKAIDGLLKCCRSTKWAHELIKKRPFENIQDLFEKSDRIWSTCTKKDGLEAFSHHPEIGSIKNSEKKFASSKKWARNEQSAINKAKQETLIALAKGNNLYKSKFGFIFIVCATGKSAEEMLNLLHARMENDYETEFSIAMNEQNKITKIRLKKLLL